MNVASSNTVTVNNSVFITGDSVFIANKGAGVTSIASGVGVTVNTCAGYNLEQFRSALLLAYSPSIFSLFLSAGAGVQNALTRVSGGTLPTPIYVDSSNSIIPSPTSNGFTIYSFLVSGSQNTSTTFGVTTTYTINSTKYLCVGGGAGAAAYNSCGGGGAGGLRTSFTTTSGFSGGGGSLESGITLNSGTTYTIVVGGGSLGVPGDGFSFSGSPADVAQGLASSISGAALTTITSFGGSPGCCNQTGATKPADYVNKPATGSQATAGCGGGARGEVLPSGTNVGGAGTANQGFAGGSNDPGTYSGNYPGGGGGGAGSVGITVTTTSTAGAGGGGVQSAITGVLQFYAGGGGGSTQASGSVDPAALGGSGVGGNGRGADTTPLNGFDGANNTGSGGGAGCNAGTIPAGPLGRGGNGSAGIVVIRIPSFN